MVFSFIGACLLVYVTVIVFIFWQTAQPAIAYETVENTGMPLAPMCPGDTYRFTVRAVARRAPAVVAITENWVSSKDPRLSVLDSQPEWRIISRPVDGQFIVVSQVPEDITVGSYRYLRALGLNSPFILELPITIKDRCP